MRDSRRLGSPERGKQRMIEERTGEAFEFDELLTVVGSKLEPGKRRTYNDP